MKEQEFDQLLKDKLGQLEEPFQPSAWAAFESRLNASLVEEQPAAVDAVDKAVFHKLDQLEAPYQPAHWNMLSERLMAIRRLRTRLWLAKSAEAVFLLLLIGNLYRHLSVPQGPLPAPKPRFNGPVAALEESRHSRNARHGEAAAPQHSAATNEHPTMALVGDFLPGDLLRSVQSVAEQSVPALPSQPDAAPASVSNQLLTASVAPLAFLNSVLAPFNWQNTAHELPAGSRIAAVKPHKQRFYFASYLGTDQNQVYVDGQSRQFSGFNSGLAVGYRKGKWGVEAGFSYAQKSYEPKKKVEIYAGNITSGYLGSYLSSVDADLITVPVKVTRQVAKFGKTSVHAVAGATTNIAARKAYRYKTVEYPGSLPSGQGPNTVGSQPQLRQTGSGVLENGKLSDNVYASADLGLRIERPVSSRFTVFVEPVYRQSLSSSQGLGPRPAR
ncbi:MAG TPA: hypothetical protein PKL15_06365, partial [Saprospiraceae bacterium]|nr:hypothetical protein [Saprospiraceae bacterium]